MGKRSAMGKRNANKRRSSTIMEKDFALGETGTPPDEDIPSPDCEEEEKLEAAASADVPMPDCGEGKLETAASADATVLEEGEGNLDDAGSNCERRCSEGPSDWERRGSQTLSNRERNLETASNNGEAPIKDRGEEKSEDLETPSNGGDPVPDSEEGSLKPPANGGVVITDGGKGNLETLARLRDEGTDDFHERALLANRLAEMEQQADLLQRQKHEFESQAGELLAERAHLATKLAELGQQADLLQRQKDEFESEVGRLLAERDLLSNEKGAMQNYAADLANRMQASEAGLRQVSDQSVEAWETERQGLMSALSQATQRISDLTAAVQDLQARNNVMVEQCLRSESLANQFSIENDGLRMNADLLNKRVERLLQENESLKLEIALKAEAMGSLEGEVRCLRSDITTGEEEREILRAFNSRMEGEFAAIESRLAAALESSERHDALVEGFQAENDRLAAEKATLQQKLDELLSVQGDAKGSELEDPVAEVVTSSAHEEASIASREIREISEASREIREISEASREIRETSEDSESLAKKLPQELEDDLISLRSSVEKMQQADIDNQKRISDLEQQVSTLVTEKTGLEDANHLLQIELDRRILGSDAEDREQFGERISDRDSANTDSESREAKVQQSTFDPPSYQLRSDDQVGERIRDLEIALDAAHKALASREITVQQLTAELQSLQSSFEAKEKGKQSSWPVKQSSWPVVAASTGAIAAAACLAYVKCSKHH